MKASLQLKCVQYNASLERLIERFRALESFQTEDQEAVIRLIDAVIVKNRAQELLDLPK